MEALQMTKQTTMFFGFGMTKIGSVRIDKECREQLDELSICRPSASLHHFFVDCAWLSAVDRLRGQDVPEECTKYTSNGLFVIDFSAKICCAEAPTACCSASPTFVILAVLLGCLVFAGALGLFWVMCCLR
eukprot:TRINITY_DN23835_c0_g1_i2.p1 TRINITY_DN23835_c0_g1~~TRINITY_DN23835_c0_g1_i2.p1  ORF type:complete len:131 (+),score=20.38 TRINITY_DN23835_c0_g1_i2:191-583(+)